MTKKRKTPPDMESVKPPTRHLWQGETRDGRPRAACGAHERTEEHLPTTPKWRGTTCGRCKRTIVYETRKTEDLRARRAEKEEEAATVAETTAAPALESIPIGALRQDPDNVRTWDVESQADAELVADIRARGVLQNLVVRPDPDPALRTYLVMAGGRRLRACLELVREGHLTEDDRVPCQVRFPDPETSEAAEISLAENLARVPLHPADQIEAFARLAETGMSAEAIGARFGYTERHVLQRLALAGVPKPIREAYRDGRVKMEAMRAFSTTTRERALAAFDHAVAEREAGGRSGPVTGWEIERRLDDARVEAGSVLGSFIREEYEAAGGPLDRDLFWQHSDDRTYLADCELAEELAERKLMDLAERLREAEGWAFADVHMDLTWDELEKYARARPVRRGEPTDEERERLYELRTAQSRHGWSRERASEIQEIDDRVRGRAVHPKGTGCVLTLGHNGAKIHRGRWRPGQEPGGGKKAKKARGDGGPSAKGLDRLRHLRGDVIRANMDPNTAWLLLGYTLALKVFAPRAHLGLPVSVRAESQMADTVHGPLTERLAEVPLEWCDESVENTWAAWLELDPEDRIELIVMAVSALLVPALSDVAPAAVEHAAANLDIDWRSIRPDADYWKGYRKGDALKVAREVLGRDAVRELGLAKLGKADLTRALAEAFADADWTIPGLAPREETS